MEKYDVVKDWEKVDFEGIERVEEYLLYENRQFAKYLQEFIRDIELLRDKQLKTFPKLERK